VLVLVALLRVSGKRAVLCRHIQRWCKVWGEDLDRRPDAIKKTGPGGSPQVVCRKTKWGTSVDSSRLSARKPSDRLILKDTNDTEHVTKSMAKMIELRFYCPSLVKYCTNL